MQDRDAMKSFFSAIKRSFKANLFSPESSWRFQLGYEDGYWAGFKKGQTITRDNYEASISEFTKDLIDKHIPDIREMWGAGIIVERDRSDIFDFYRNDKGRIILRVIIEPKKHIEIGKIKDTYRFTARTFDALGVEDMGSLV
jgi:hypothetical protein